MCTHYGAGFAACASALGWVARSIIVDHHCLAEVWSEELQKWILEDAGPCREFDANYEIDGLPINALELHEAAAGKKRKKLMANKLPQKVIEPMTKYINVFCRFGIPLRNNHPIFAEPAELRHGAGEEQAAVGREDGAADGPAPLRYDLSDAVGQEATHQ